MRAQSIGFVGAVLGAVALGCSSDPRPLEPREHARVGRVDSRIQGGAEDAADPAVGLVLISGGGLCSGALIAPDVVLTAGHCVAGGTVVSFSIGSGRKDPVTGVLDRTSFPADAQVKNPSYVPGGCPNPTPDVGLVHLAAPVPDVDPIPYATVPPDPATAVCVSVGFGRHEVAPGGATLIGQKYIASVTLDAVGPSYVKISMGDGIPDHGDSGGPLLCDGFVVGDSSCHKDGNWPAHTVEYSGRIDAVSDWIAGQIAAWDPPPPVDPDPPPPVDDPDPPLRP